MRQINPNARTLKTGRVLAIDPGSLKFGWAYYEAGVLIKSGQFHVKNRWPHHRLKMMVPLLNGLPPCDILITEKISKWNKATVPKSYLALLKSIGVIVGNTTWKYCIELSPNVWQAVISEHWQKSNDENDAIALGEAAIKLAGMNDNSNPEESSEVQAIDS
jgi:hypothetical protein